MKQVFEDFANIAAGIVGGVIKSIPEAGTQQYWIMLGTLLALLALLMVWLVLRLRRARLARRAAAVFTPQVTFADISAEAAAESPSQAPHPRAAPELPAGAAAVSSGSENEPVSGFRFFKKKTKDAGLQPAGDATARGADDIDDDIYLLGLEQEMLATRQLYLDGLITKEVYVSETRALYDKAQSRMT